MIERIIISGFGGQGIMLMGKIIAQAALKEDRQVTFMPSYGAEVRGGTAHCMVVISDSEIASPIVSDADTLIIMNEPSMEKFKDRLRAGVWLIANSSLVESADKKRENSLTSQFSDIAASLGNIKVANMVAIGAYIARKKIISSQSVLAVIEEIAPGNKRHLIEINQKALQEGMGLVK